MRDRSPSTPWWRSSDQHQADRFTPAGSTDPNGTTVPPKTGSAQLRVREREQVESNERSMSTQR